MNNIETIFKQTDIGLIPEDWTTIKIGEVSKVIRGASPRPKGDPKYYGGKVPRLMVQDVSRDGMYVYPKIDSLTEAGAKLSRPVKKGTLVIQVSGNPGTPSILVIDACIHDGFSALIDLNLEKIQLEYLYYNLLYKKDINSRLAVGSIFKNLQTSLIRDFEIPLPPLAEQKKIAHVLSKIQQAIETQEQIIKTTQELKKALMQKLFTEGFNGEPQKQTEIGLIPESWEVVTLDDYTFKPQYGFTESAVSTGNVQFLRITDITDRGVDWSTVPNCVCPDEKVDTFLLEHNDIVFARIGATTGKSFILKEPPKSVFASYLIRVKVKDELNPDYLFAFFNSSTYWKQIDANKGANLKGGFNASLLSRLKIPFPDDINIQNKIACVFLELNNKILYHDKQRFYFNDLFKSSLKQLMTGQIRVKDIEFKLEEMEYI